AFFAEESRKKRVFESHRVWFIDLFSGNYDSRYYDKMIKVGQIHERAKVDPHFIITSFNIIRSSCKDILHQYVDDKEKRSKTLNSIDKIVDINLDIMTSSYIEEEVREYSPAYRVRTALIAFSERFSQTMNFVLIVALIGLTLGVIGLFIYDLQYLLSGNLEKGIITALGSMLMLWIVIELMNTEIKHLKGGRFRISVFVGVALVAFIRDTLIMALKHENVENMYFLSALILILGIVFWLVTKAEERSS